MNRRPPPFTLAAAAEESPTLAGLMARVRETNARLEAVRDLIPPAMRPAVQAGPVEGGEWCLLVRGSAAAAKLRQLLPLLAQRLEAQGFGACTLRIKVHTGR